MNDHRADHHAGAGQAEASADDPTRRADEDDVTAITISGRIAFPVVLIVLVGAAVFAGRRVLVPSESRSTSPVLAAAPTPAFSAATTQFTDSSSPGLQVTSDGEISPGTVIDVAWDIHPLVGQSAPEIEGVLLDGSPSKLSDQLGQPVMINFWATWCPPCRTEMPWLEEAYKAHEESKLTVLAVDAGERVPSSMVSEVVSDFATAMSLTLPVMLPDDPYSSQRQYSVLGLPATFMVNGEGVVVAAHRGMFPNRATLAAFIERSPIAARTSP